MIHENLVSVVVCTHNGARLLPVALDALARQRPPAGGFEVVVVDDHSTDAAGAKVVRLTCHARRSPVNTGAPPVPKEARVRVLGIQRKLHKWASDDPQRRFSDLHNLVCEPAVLMVARLRVRSNTGSRSAGVDGQTARHIEDRVGVERFLDGSERSCGLGASGRCRSRSAGSPNAAASSVVSGCRARSHQSTPRCLLREPTRRSWSRACGSRRSHRGHGVPAGNRIATTKVHADKRAHGREDRLMSSV